MLVVVAIAVGCCHKRKIRGPCSLMHLIAWYQYLTLDPEEPLDRTICGRQHIIPGSRDSAASRSVVYLFREGSAGACCAGSYQRQSFLRASQFHPTCTCRSEWTSMIVSLLSIFDNRDCRKAELIGMISQMTRWSAAYKVLRTMRPSDSLWTVQQTWPTQVRLGSSNNQVSYRFVSSILTTHLEA